MKYSILFVLVFQASCASSYTKQVPANKNIGFVDKANSISNSSPTPSNESLRTQNNQIRTVDFSNFTYDWYPDWGEISVKDKKIILRNGKMDVDVPSGVNAPTSFFLVDVEYGDLTGDDIEEAVVTIGIFSPGTARPHCIFVYALHKQPKILWTYETGDRADGGYRRAFVENGKLVIEKYKANTWLVDGKEIATATSSFFTQDYYKWGENKFEKIKTEELPNSPEDSKPWVVPHGKSKSS